MQYLFISRVISLILLLDRGELLRDGSGNIFEPDHTRLELLVHLCYFFILEICAYLLDIFICIRLAHCLKEVHNGADLLGAY